MLNIYHWVRRLHPFLEECQAAYGDLFRVNLGAIGQLALVAHPDGVRQVFAIPPERFSMRASYGLLEPVVGPQSLLLQEGEPHRRTRRLLTPPFNGKRMRAYAGVMAEETRRVCAAWRAGQTIRFQEQMQAVSLAVILRAVFGIEGAALQAEATAAILNLLEVPAFFTFVPMLQKDLGRWSPGGIFATRLAAVHRIIDAEIAQRRSTGARGEDILSAMLDAGVETGEAMSDAELRDQLITLLTAGHETTATTLAWALGWLLTEPEVLARVTDEVRALGASPDPAQLAELPYLGATLDEALRITPVLPIAVRGLTEEVEVLGRRIPAGMKVAPCIYLVHHRPDLYPEPGRFRPERFLERSYAAHEYLPFGGGGRRCLGMAFALYEMRVVLGLVLANARFEALRPGPPRVVRRSVTVAPADGLPVRVAATG